MTTRSQKVRLGVFLLVSGLMMFGAVATLAGLKLWNPRDRYFIEFEESISGLEVGSTVKMKGVRVGQVERVRIGRDVEHVVVDLALKPGTPVTTETRAIMTSIGITGMQFVELTGGTAAAKRVPPNLPTSRITPGSSTLQTLTGQATSIGIKFEAVLNNLLALTSEKNRVRIEQLLVDTDKLVVTWEALARENGPRLSAILASLAKATASLQATSDALGGLATDNRASVKQTLAAAAQASLALRKAAEDLRPQAALGAITSAADAVRKRADDQSLGRAIRAFGDAAAGLSQLTAELRKTLRNRDQQTAEILRNLDRASADLKQFARTIRERPAVLLRGDATKER